MKVAIVHDYLNQYGGAERVLEQISAVYPQADIKTAIHDPDRMPASYRALSIEATWLNRLPRVNRYHRLFLPVYPRAFESIDLSGYDLVVTSSSGFAHGVIVKPDTVNVCYCHSPPRFLWDYENYVAREEISPLRQALLRPMVPRLRKWDRMSADRTDAWITTSELVKERVELNYGKTSTIIPPSVDVSRFEVGQGPGQHYLMLMRMVGWKRPDIVVEACTRRNLPLVVAGDGRSLEGLRKIAGPTVRFVGRVNDEQMRPLYRDSKALILPSEEDFGITPLEAMASGRPVIAFGKGGVLDTVIPGVTGVFFEQQTEASILGAIDVFERTQFDAAAIRRHADRFDNMIFRDRLKTFVDEQIALKRGARRPDAALQLADA